MNEATNAIANSSIALSLVTTLSKVSRVTTWTMIATLLITYARLWRESMDNQSCKTSMPRCGLRQETRQKGRRTADGGVWRRSKSRGFRARNPKLDIAISRQAE
ncbi:hypothetical protein K504DRAFT_155189 [Pleomassaria siparia CBS 279.74]|uniref:Uncharacterized protein n=1 Tax=Pleomassaria siparia CBS 279.74 TaxID=1314801 RepID=A0A6G1KMR7_9PLEO|nr:hypothetical protein K504DRAFT_155189 [Pleomassaria siparia CBS 279.74]